MSLIFNGKVVSLSSPSNGEVVHFISNWEVVRKEIVSLVSNGKVVPFVSNWVVPFGLRVLQAAPSGRLRICKVRYILNRERAFETIRDLPPCQRLLFSSFTPSNPPIEPLGLSP